MNPEQITARINEMADQQEGVRQEVVRRAQEHQMQHREVEALKQKIRELEQNLDALSSGNGER